LGTHEAVSGLHTPALQVAWPMPVNPDVVVDTDGDVPLAVEGRLNEHALNVAVMPVQGFGPQVAAIEPQVPLLHVAWAAPA
jgi:hypothetical protein